MLLIRIALILALLTSCASIVPDASLRRFGPADPQRHDQPLLAGADQPSYQRHIKPIFESRCVVCHGCFYAPCQLKLGSWEGVARGMSKASVYGELRLHEAPTTRLGVDAQQASQWREKGFEPVLNERTLSPANQLAASVLWRSLMLKQDHPLPVGGRLSDADFGFSLDRRHSCPRLDEFDAHAQAQPLAGMPYGMHGLSADQIELVGRWLMAGAPDDAQAVLPAVLMRQIEVWEQFLNGATPKQQLVARYLYEHLFLGNLVFEGDAQRHVFKLVRSSTPPGQPVQIIATRRPFDDPGVRRPHYRLVWERETLLAKTHMPYVLSQQRLARWQSGFLNAPYKVDQLPSYASATASNPFKTFAAIPLMARYGFLLDDAGFFVSNFIKGPVCRGQTALDVINDRFWVFFVDPAIGGNDDAAELVAREAELLRMPAGEGRNPGLLAWRAVAAAEERLLRK